MLIKRIIYDGKEIIRNGACVLCEIINDKDETEIKFIPSTHLKSLGVMDDSLLTQRTSWTKDIHNEKENNESKFSSYTYKWNDNETKYLLDKYRLYYPQIGPFQAFKNKIAMFEQIGKDLCLQFGITVTGQQCMNRFKNAQKHRNNTLSRNKVSGNSSTEIPYADEFQDIASIDDSLEPEVLVGVSHVKVNEKMKANIAKRSLNISDTSDSETIACENPKICGNLEENNINPKKRLKSNSLEHVLREIFAAAEANRDRRHKEKCNLLLSLFGKPS